MRLHHYMIVMAGIALLGVMGLSVSAADSPGYKVIRSEKVGGAGGFDYVFADSAGRKLYVPRSGGRGAPGRVVVYDLDSLKSLGEIPNAMGVHGVAVDSASGHGFVSCNPVIMFDTNTLAVTKTIPVQGSPDGILFDPGSGHIFVLSHRAPNVTVINAADGALVGTIDLGGAPEEGASDGAGHVYIDLEDKDAVAVVDSKANTLTTTYSLGDKGGGPAGLGLDAKNHILFAFCHQPANAVILNADNGKIITALPIGTGVDAGEFNPNTMEAFASTGDGKLTVIKEQSPTDFMVEQTVQTKTGAKTSTLDAKTGQIYLITAEYGAPATRPAAPPQQGGAAGPGGGGGGRRGRPPMVPDSFTILVVGK